MSKVYLIGAGPGNEELVTVKAVSALRKCTAVLYDRLAGEKLLKYLNQDCKIFYCGKEPGSHYKTQEEINNMLIALAKQGHIVGRIKGGDPYVFGRGGEEALELFKENIPFEVIPGVTSAISVLNYAGIPITQRGIAQSFHVFTGMSAEKLNIDWDSTAKLSGTLVFLMGLENIEMITEHLIDRGMNEKTPSAVIMNGTTSRQKTVIGELGEIAAKARTEGLKSPCIIVIGEVVTLKDKLNWYEKLPLFGLNVCVTRSKEQSLGLCENLVSLGAEVTEINAIKIKSMCENLDGYLDKLENYDYIIMNSVNCVNIFFNYLKEKRYDIRKLRASFAVIGPATEKALLDRGITADIVAEEFIEEGLYKILEGKLTKQNKVFIPCSGDSRRLLIEKLKKLNCIVDETHIYKTEKGEITNPNIFKNVDVVLFTSPSGVKNLIDIMGAETIKSKINIAIGPITQKALTDNNINSYVSDIYTTEGMLKKLIELKAQGGNKCLKDIEG